MKYKTLVKNYHDGYKIEYRIPSPKFYRENKIKNGRFKFDDTTLGEIAFFDSPFFGLHLMFGCNWTDWKISKKSGFSVMNIKHSERIYNTIKKFLDDNHIIYREKTSPAGWQVSINISVRKSNLEKVDKLYERFYRFINNNQDFDEAIKAWLKANNISI